ncbi:MAG: acetate--CoA ligase family protein [Tateyamaria sp.]
MLTRLLRPKSIAVIGGGAWCASVIAQAERFGFDGAIWPVHPTKPVVGGLGTFPTVGDLPTPPDAAFVGVNRHATVDVIDQLSRAGSGGAVCFASGFSEATSEDADASDLQMKLVEAAGDMPILGPNCYGFINALDQALLWPDQHGCTPVDRGVAILTQSSNIAINMTMQKRALPIAYTLTCGNMAQTRQADIARALLDDARVTALGLHVEGFGGIRAWEALAKKAHERGVPIVVLKTGASDQARQAAVSHTASLAGSDAGAQAFLDRMGFARVTAVPDFLETLKLLHVSGAVKGQGIASISCSGGEASLAADMALETGLQFPPLTADQDTALLSALGPMVARANPLDYHTYIWRDVGRMADAWSAMTGPHIGMTLSIVDYPHTDAADWACATAAAKMVRERTQAPFGIVSTLPELMPLDVARDLMGGGVVPFFGLREALNAIDATRSITAPHPDPLCLSTEPETATLLTEADAKSELAAMGLPVPACQVLRAETDADAPIALQGPLAVKGVGLAHKTEAQAIRLNVTPSEVHAVMQDIGTETVLVEEMITDGVAELLIGVIRDPAHGFVLTLVAGGVWTELSSDTVTLLWPVTAQDVETALPGLRYAEVLRGYRGAEPANQDGVVDAVLAIQSYVLAHAETVSEVEVNPLICTPTRAVAVDALIRKA